MARNLLRGVGALAAIAILGLAYEAHADKVGRSGRRQSRRLLESRGKRLHAAKASRELGRPQPPTAPAVLQAMAALT
jgi:hypothetical protein